MGTRPGNNPNATPEQNARATELASKHGNLSKAIFKYIIDNHSDGTVFKNSDISDEMGIHRGVVATVMRRWSSYDLSNSYIATQVTNNSWSVVGKHTNPRKFATATFTKPEPPRDEQGAIQPSIPNIGTDRISIIARDGDNFLFSYKEKLYAAKPYKLEF